VPNDFVAEVHDRMPVLLTKEQFAPWLTGEAGAEYLKPASNDYLQRWPVSKRVNSSKADADDATLVDKVEIAAASRHLDVAREHCSRLAGRYPGVTVPHAVTAGPVVGVRSVTVIRVIVRPSRECTANNRTGNDSTRQRRTPAPPSFR
jgi:SOS response associated peptidase (SRAP)